MRKDTASKDAKIAFILGFPSAMPADEVVERAKTKRMKLSRAYVYAVRSGINTGKIDGKKYKNGNGAKDSETRTVVVNDAQLETLIKDKATGSPAAIREVHLCELMKAVGLKRAHELLDQLIDAQLAELSNIRGRSARVAEQAEN